MAKNRQRIIIAIVVVVLAIAIVGLVMFMTRRVKITPIKASALSDSAWKLITPIVDDGGVAIVRDKKGDEFLILGKSDQEYKDDTRDMSVKIAYKKDDGERVRYINFADPSTTKGERGWSEVNPSNRPVAVYKIKTRKYDSTYMFDSGIKSDITFYDLLDGKFLR